jgi:DNA-binding SARP family transcriptional activator/DNA-binding CsgD family transcriptional regulator
MAARTELAPQSAPESTDLRLGVLGEMTARLGGAPVDLGGPRQRAVLGLLVVARGDVVPADSLVDALWGEEPPPSATSALQAYVSHLRRRLEPGRGPRDRQSVLARQGPGYALRIPDDAVDAWEFERMLRAAGVAESAADARHLLDEALGLWRGPAYADHQGEHWADVESTRLAGLRDVAREHHLDARLRSGETAVLVPEIEAMVAENPLREERWRLLVLALYRAHRQADALAALRRARTMLAEELGVDPGPALRALEAEVLAQSPSLDLPAAVAVVAAPEKERTPSEKEPSDIRVPARRSGDTPRRRSADAPPRPAADAPGSTAGGESLVGRDRELNTLRAALDEVFGGNGRLALIDGPAGIGKSRLLQEVRREAAARGALVLTARGSQLERDFAYGAVRQLYEGLLADPDRRARLLAGSAAAATSVFEADEPEVERRDGSFSVLHGLYWLTVNLSADQPVVLSVDDLQWCDTGSTRALAYLLRRLEGLPVLVAASVRTHETVDDDTVAELTSDLATVTMHLGPLGAQHTAALVRTQLGETAHESFIAACHRTTGGNPLLLRQLLHALRVEGIRPDASHAHTVNAIGSRAISSLVLMRLRRLPPDCLVVARAVAVLGDGAELPAVAALSGLEEPAAAAAIAQLARAEVLRLDRPLGFVHPLIGEAVYADIAPGERELRHEQAAAVRRDLGGSAEQVAAHLMLTPRRGNPRVVTALHEAADTAAGRGAADAASAYLKRALDEPAELDVRPRLLVDLGRLATMTNGPDAVGHLQAAYAALADPRERAEVAIMLARTMVFAAAPGEATGFARAARAGLPPELDDARQGLVALEHASGYMHGLPPSEWLQGLPTPSGTGLGARMLAAVRSFLLMIDIGDRQESAEFAKFALTGDELLRNDPGLLWVVAAFTLEMTDETTGDFWDRALAAAHARGSLFTALSVHLWRGHMLWHHGRLPEALHSVHTANEQVHEWGAPAVTNSYGQAFAVGIMLEQGDLTAARRFVDSVPRQERFGDGGRLYRENCARLLSAEGHHEEALAELDITQTMQSSVRNPVWRPWRSYRAGVLAGLGRPDEARELMAEEVELARQWGAPSVLGRTLRAAGELGGADAEGMLREGHELLEGSVARYEFARVELALARAVSDASERESLLRGALGGALECGSPGLYRETAAELQAMGIEVPADAADAVSVTESERRMVLRLSAGAAYRDIAEEFFLTPAAVERRLRDLRTRLGVSDDSALPDALAQL